MDEIKERVIIEVDEEPNRKEEDIVVTLNTGESGEATILTDDLEGELECLIITTSATVDVTIRYELWPSFEILNVRSIPSENYIAPRLSPMDSKGEAFNFAPVKWILRGPLRVSIDGGRNIQTTIIIKRD